MSRNEPLQRCIILHLAQTKPQTINETAKGISKDYKSSWIAFKKLEKKGLVKEVNKKYYRGNQFSYFWLTEIGILQALNEDADPKHLLNQTLEIYPQNRYLQFFIEATLIFGTVIVTELGEDILGDPEKVETSLISCLSANLMSLASEIQNPIVQKQIAKLRILLKKYPELHRRLPDELEQYAEQLRKIAIVLRQQKSGEQMERAR